MICPFLGDDGCIIKRTHRPYVCLQYRCSAFPFAISTEKVVDYLRCTGGFAPALQQVAGRQLAVKAAAEKGLAVSDEELQQASDAWRAVNGLFSAIDTNECLEDLGLTIDKYEAYLETNLLIFKLKQALASEAKIEDIFSDPQCREAAIELLYADWLAGAVK